MSRAAVSIRGLAEFIAPGGAANMQKTAMIKLQPDNAKCTGFEEAEDCAATASSIGYAAEAGEFIIFLL